MHKRGEPNKHKQRTNCSKKEGAVLQHPAADAECGYKKHATKELRQSTTRVSSGRPSLFQITMLELALIRVRAKSWGREMPIPTFLI